MATEPNIPRQPLGVDGEDFLMAIINIWIVLDIMKENLPEKQKESASLAIENLSNSMVSLMQRHNIEINPVMVDKQDE